MKQSNIWTRFQKWLDQRDQHTAKPTALFRYLLRVIFISVRQFNKNDLSLRSSALTYAILLSMVPMLAMSTAVVKGLGGGNQLREAAYSYLDNLERIDNSSKVHGTPTDQDRNDTTVPETTKANLTTHLRSAVTQLFDYVDKTNFATLGTFGVVGILLSVILVLGNIESAMNSIWRVNKGRGILRKIADYLTLLILLPLSINLAFAASAFVNNSKLAGTIDNYIPFDWIQTLLLQALPMLFITVSFYVMYIFFPNTKVKTIPACIGAAIAACCWLVIQNIYISMQIGVAKYNAIYGSFATVPLFLVWIYLSWIFILIGAQVAFAVQNEKSTNLIEPTSKPSILLSGAFDIVDYIYAAFEGKKTIRRDDIVSHLSAYPAKIIDTVLVDLTRGGFIVEVEKSKLYLPLYAKERLETADIVEAILGAETTKTSGGKRSFQALQGAKQTEKNSEPQST